MTTQNEVVRSPKFEQFKKDYEANERTIDNLRGYVRVGLKRPELGITAEEFELITGVEY